MYYVIMVQEIAGGAKSGDGVVVGTNDVAIALRLKTHHSFVTPPPMEVRGRVFYCTMCVSIDARVYKCTHRDNSC